MAQHDHDDEASAAIRQIHPNGLEGLQVIRTLLHLICLAFSGILSQSGHTLSNVSILQFGSTLCLGKSKSLKKQHSKSLKGETWFGF